MGFLKDPHLFICVLQTVLEMTNFRFILFTAGYKPLESVVHMFANETSDQRCLSEDCVTLFSGRLLCFSGWVFPLSLVQENWVIMACKNRTSKRVSGISTKRHTTLWVLAIWVLIKGLRTFIWKEGKCLMSDYSLNDDCPFMWTDPYHTIGFSLNVLL